MERINGEIVTDTAPDEGGGRVGFFGSIVDAIKDSFAKRQDGATAPLYDAVIFALSFIFARCHIVFGAFPVAIGVIAVLPTRVWLAVLGSVAGALTLGNAGIIYSLISVVVAFLRIIISGTDKRERTDGTPVLFHEGLLLRMATALIGGFIIGIYEILLNSFTTESALFGAAMVILPPIITFALSGLFDAGISPGDVFFDVREIFSVHALTEDNRFAIIFFQCSALFAIFLISISLGAYELLGISAGYVFSGVITLFSSRRFGALRGAAVGFVSSVGLSGTYSVAFTLAGLVSGGLASLGIIPSALLGAVALSVWGGYVDGVLGFLSLFPEYAIAAAVAIPLFKRIRLERTAEEVADAKSIAEDMVGTMALAYKSRYSGSLDALEVAFGSLARLAKEARERNCEIRDEELKRLATECITRYFNNECARLPGSDEARAIFLSKVDEILPLLRSGKRVTRDDFGTAVHLSLMASGISEAINRAVAIVTEERFRESVSDTSAEDFEYISKLINEARLADSAEKSTNENLRRAAEGVLERMGLAGSAVQVYGERDPHFIIAAEDEAGSIITSPLLKSGIEEACGFTLAAPEYYRKGKMALMECHAERGFTAVSASAGTPMSEESSGDTARSFETAEHRYYSLIADGMGSGEEAVMTSAFAADFLTRTLEFGNGVETALRLLNNIIRRRRSECSATVDLFSFDLMTGEGIFYKCGAAPSYVKRGSSLYRIRSRTSPIGIGRDLDAERIRVELEDGDFIIMFSDGVSQDGESPWLLETLSRTALSSAAAISDAIMSAARAHEAGKDDLSVIVTRVETKKKKASAAK